MISSHASEATFLGALRRHREVLITMAYVVTSLALGMVWYLRLDWRADAWTTSDAWANTITATIVATIILGVLHWYRQRASTSIMIAGLVVVVLEAVVVGSTSIGSLIIFSDLLYVATLNSSARWVPIASVVTGFATAVALVGLVFVPLFPDVVLRFLSILVVVGMSIWWGRAVRIPRIEAERERERAAAIELAALESQRDAIRSERASISRDLHDVVAGHLSAIAIRSEAALARTPDLAGATADPARRSLEAIRSISVDALGDMRAMIDVLRSDLADDAELTSPATLEDLAGPVEKARAAGLAVTVRGDRGHDGLLAALPPASSIAGFRVIQEALTNTQKYAAGSEVIVTISFSVDRTAPRVTVQVTDSGGRGEPNSGARPGGGLGLLGLSERVRLAGGRFEAGPVGSEAGAGAAGAGWRVRAELPASTTSSTGVLL